MQVIKNMQAGSEYLLNKGFKLVSGGTDNHLCLIDMRSKGTDGGRIQALTEHTLISLNKNTVPGDKSALNPSGIRIGSPAMTTRGCKTGDYIQIMKFLERVTEITNNISKKVPGTKLKDFKEALKGELENSEIISLRKEVEDFTKEFPVPGGNI